LHDIDLVAQSAQWADAVRQEGLGTRSCGAPGRPATTYPSHFGAAGNLQAVNS